MLFNDINL